MWSSGSLFSCFFVTFWLCGVCTASSRGQTTYLLTVVAGRNSSVILRVGTETQEEFSFVESGGNVLSRHCNNSRIRKCNLLVREGSKVGQYVVFIPLDNGVWIVYLELGSSVKKLGSSTVSYGRTCHTLGISVVQETYVILCTDSNNHNELHECEISVDLNNASSTPNNLCGGIPGTVQEYLESDFQISNIVQTGNRFNDARLYFFQETNLYSYYVLDRTVILERDVVSCNFVSDIHLLNNSVGYIYCNDTSIYLLDFTNDGARPHLVRNTTQQSYPCVIGIYSITGNEIQYSVLDQTRLALQLSLPLVTSVICIGTSTLLYEDEQSNLNVIYKTNSSLNHATIDSGRRSTFLILNNSYVVLIRSDNIIIVERDSSNSKRFQFTSSALPSMISLISTATTDTTLTTQTETLTMQTERSSNSTYIISTEVGKQNGNWQYLGFLVVVPVVLTLLLVAIVVPICYYKRKQSLHQSESGIPVTEGSSPNNIETSNTSLCVSPLHDSGMNEGETCISPELSSDLGSRATAMVSSRTLENVRKENVRDNMHKNESEERQNDLREKMEFINCIL